MLGCDTVFNWKVLIKGLRELGNLATFQTLHRFGSKLGSLRPGTGQVLGRKFGSCDLEAWEGWIP